MIKPRLGSAVERDTGGLFGRLDEPLRPAVIVRVGWEGRGKSSEAAAEIETRGRPGTEVRRKAEKSLKTVRPFSLLYSRQGGGSIDGKAEQRCRCAWRAGPDACAGARGLKFFGYQRPVVRSGCTDCAGYPVAAATAIAKLGRVRLCRRNRAAEAEFATRGTAGERISYWRRAGLQDSGRTSLRRATVLMSQSERWVTET